jgi:uncharacterized protein YegL
MSDAVTPRMNVVVDVNEFVASGASRIDAAVVITPEGFENVSVTREKLFILVVDTSGSMADYSGSKLSSTRIAKIEDARRACAKLIDLIPENEWFAVVTFSTGARTLVGLCQAQVANRQAAKRAVQGIRAEGSTEMSAGLSRALDEFLKHPGADGVLIFMTDGQNNEQDLYPLHRQLERCVQLRKDGKVIQSQCCGIGTDWHVDQLRQIVAATLGEPPYLVSDPSELEAHFAQCLEAAMANTISDVTVNVWTPQAVQLEAFKQTVPSILDLSHGAKLAPDGQTRQFATGAWSSEPREFYMGFGLQPQPDGKRVCAGRVSVSYTLNGQQVATPPQNIVASWTGDQSLSARIPMGIARATGQVELAQSIQEGVKAYEQGDLETATSKFGRAVQLAKAAGDEETTSRLRGMVEIVDADSGTVRVKKAVDKAVAMDLDAQSTRTTRRRA